MIPSYISRQKKIKNFSIWGQISHNLRNTDFFEKYSYSLSVKSNGQIKYILYSQKIIFNTKYQNYSKKISKGSYYRLFFNFYLILDKFFQMDFTKIHIPKFYSNVPHSKAKKLFFHIKKFWGG